MIKTVAEFLTQLRDREVARLDADEVRHAPTIGDMYEGLSADLLGRAIPPALGLRLVSGFIVDGQGNTSGQIDCMLVQGSGESIPYTTEFRWHVKDVIAVIEVKKNLFAAQLGDALEHLNEVRTLQHNYLQSTEGQTLLMEPLQLRRLQRDFAQVTGRFPPASSLEEMDPEDRQIWALLMMEMVNPLRIVLGYHGFKSEAAFRNSVIEFLEARIGKQGFGPGGLPTLIVCGHHSIVKANAHPYACPPLDDGQLRIYFSTTANPLLLLLEFVWTRLSERFDIGGWWGEDLESEIAKSMLTVRVSKQGSKMGWEYGFWPFSDEELATAAGSEPWEPTFLTRPEYVVVEAICREGSIDRTDAGLAEFLTTEGANIEEVVRTLRESGLVALDGDELVMTTQKCARAILPDGRFAAAEDNTGRLTRWVTTNYGKPSVLLPNGRTLPGSGEAAGTSRDT